jgi:hypothetical protein
MPVRLHFRGRPSIPQRAARVLVLSSVVFVAWGAWEFAWGRRGLQFRSAYASAIGYNGCMCSDCVAHFLGWNWVAPGQHQMRLISYFLDREEFGLAMMGYGATQATLGWGLVRIPLRPRRDRCWKCGYSREGLPTPVCPECGVNMDRPQ